MTRVAIVLALLAVACNSMRAGDCERACHGRVKDFLPYVDFVGRCSCWPPAEVAADDDGGAR